jgi:hypothetical protein
LVWPYHSGMGAEALAVGLFVLGAAIGLVGGWINPPRSLSARAVVGIFAALSVLGGAIVFVQTRSTVSSAAPTVSSTPDTTATGPVYVSADRFRRIGPASGGFSVALSGTSIVIRAPHGNGHQWGVLLPDHDWCGDGSISFDVRLDTGSGMNGFAVLPTGIDDNSSPVGDAMLFYRDTDGTFIAENSKLPTPFIGAIGGGSYAVGPLTSTSHMTVAIKDQTFAVWVDGTRAGDYAKLDSQSCGEVMIVGWGGTTIYIDHVLLR